MEEVVGLAVETAVGSRRAVGRDGGALKVDGDDERVAWG
jgi:hypothetical protein